MVLYREKERLSFSKSIISQKIIYQFQVINKKNESLKYVNEIKSKSNIKEIELVEARASKEYFRNIHIILNQKIDWFGRKSHNKDILNRLLDIGYHFLSEKIIKICQKIDIPTEIGFFHKAQSKNSHPFVYDFIEWLRPLVVDRTLLHFLKKKKNKMKSLDARDIKYFVYLLNKSLKTYFYNKNLKYCIPLEYWVEILLLHFENCVYENKVYKPNFPSIRHENRCKTKPLSIEALRLILPEG